MTTSTLITTLISGLINSAPDIIIWIIALVLSLVLLGKNGGLPARLLVIGSSLLLAVAILSISQTGLVFYLHTERGLEAAALGAAMTGVNLFFGLIRLAGAILIFIGIWKKFNEKAVLVTEQ